MKVCGIQHQFTDRGQPWQNGRIERLFGTLKEKLDQWVVDSSRQLEDSLIQFRFWYNQIRPHQNLEGRTPSEVWSHIDVYATKPKKRYWFEAWDGLLSGYYLEV
jgi:putative transposase